jgi:phenylalanyl-tRNA synthetase beta subunit
MREILPTWQGFERHELTADEAKKEYPENPYKHELIDEFTKDGKTSRAYRFVFQSDTKTLTEAEVEEWMKILHAEIEKDSAYTLR